MEITEGPRTVILGPNGAGKSVLMRLCHGLLRPTSGSISWRGAANGGRRQAMVFQRPVMLRRSALANVVYGLKLAGISPARAHVARARRARSAWAWRMSPTGRRACSPAASSSGSRSRARGRSGRKCCFWTSPPRISIPARRARSRSIIGQIRAGGTKIVMTTHNLGQAKRLGDEILFLNQGRLVERAPVEQFFQQTGVGRSRRLHPRRTAMELNRRNLLDFS